MGPVRKSENPMSWSSGKFLATKNKLLALHYPAHQAVAHNIGWFNGMHFPRFLRVWRDVTMSKEGPSVEETQDVGGRWCPCRDQAQGRSHGPGRPRVCVEFFDTRFSGTEISALALLLATLSSAHLRKAPS